MKREMKVKNIKCSLQSSHTILEGKLKKNGKYKISFGSATLIIYGHSPLLINMTGLKSMKEVDTTRNFIEVAYNVKCSNLSVDNIFYSHKDCRNIDMNALYYHVRDCYRDTHFIDYNIELFPGLYMKSKIKGIPTLILFRTGSYTIMGCKSIIQVKEYKLFIINLLNHFVK